MIDQEVMQDAVQCFGSTTVHDVLEMVGVSDPDCMYTLYQDMGMDEHAECLEMLFFG